MREGDGEEAAEAVEAVAEKMDRSTEKIQIETEV